MRFGIDLGGTKIEIIVLADNGRELFRKRVLTPQGDYQATLVQICQLVADAEYFLQQGKAISGAFSARQKIPLGIGIPGALSLKTGRVKNANSVCLIGQPLQSDLETRLQRKIRISNDANCLTVSEATDGAAAAQAVVFGVIIGTGTGGGICINQQVLTGANAVAGEWAHNPLPWRRADDGETLRCYCGQLDCIETFLSGPGMLRRFNHTIAVTGKASSTQEIVTRAEQGDEAAESFLVLYEDWMARALASVINILDPDSIVLAGGLSNMQRLYQNVPRRWSDYVFSDAVNTRLEKALHGDSSGVRGAAWLWPRGTFHEP